MSVEVEVKALVSNPDVVFDKIKQLYNIENTIESSQLNHYFSYTDESLIEFKKYISNLQLFYKFVLEDNISKLAIRTRWDSVKGTLLIIKYSLIDNNSENGLVRKEIEIPFELSIDSLDNILLNLGLTYQSKWSRKRIEYKIGDFNICIDENSGYGYLAEVEIITDNDINDALNKCRQILKELELVELDDELLQRMFKFYSKYWSKYYGTNKVIFNDTRFI